MPQEAKDIISEADSRSLIEELLRISLHCVAFLRNIFDDDNFEDTYFVPNKTIRSTDKNVKIKRLIKGVSKESDLFQNWINQGISDAVKKGYLRAIQFAIYLEESKPLVLTESYLFEVDYRNNDISVTINNKYENDFTNLGNREKVQQLVKRLIVLTQSFNPLPTKKFISMRLLFHDSCPKYYQPTLFKDASDMTPPTIELENKSRGIIDEVGSIETGYDFVNIRILTNYGKTIKNPIKVDPFDLVCGEITFHHTPQSNKSESNENKSERAENKLSLEKFLESSKKGPVTQVVPSSLQFKEVNRATISKCQCGAGDWPEITYIICNNCNRKVHAYCYGLTPNSLLGCCYTCRSDVIDPTTITLMRIRFLWKYLSFYGLPDFSKLFKIFNISEELETKEMRIILNRLFKDRIIINSGKPVLKKNGDFVFGCGYMYPTFEGIIDNSGNELLSHKKYAIAFVPKIKAYFQIDYSCIVKQIYFPRKIKNESDVSEILHKFKEIILSDVMQVRSYTSSKCIGYEAEMENRDLTLDTTEELGNLSFEDSLSFLSQSQLMSHESIDDVQQEPQNFKRRKISINI